MSEYLQHGKFKYIDKWRSKTGNWVYKYADAANDKIRTLNDRYGPKFIEEHKFASSTGMVFVDSYVRNVIGGKKVRVESYSYEAD